MSLNSLFNRTVKTNIIIYPTDGTGRDGYITYNNSGFWKENIKPIVPKETFGRQPFAVFRSLKNTPPSWTYYSDGTGRDSYVYYNSGGLIRKYSPLARQNLQRFLREKNIDNRINNSQKIYLSKDEKIYLNKINNIQKNLVNRLYNQYKYKFKNNNTTKNNSYFNNKKKYFINNGNNTLHRSSSEIIGSQTLEPINHTLNRNDSCKFYNLNNNNNNNLFSSKNNEDLFKLKLLKSRNKHPLNYKKRYNSNIIDRYPKIKYSIESNTLNKD